MDLINFVSYNFLGSFGLASGKSLVTLYIFAEGNFLKSIFKIGSKKDPRFVALNYDFIP